MTPAPLSSSPRYAMGLPHTYINQPAAGLGAPPPHYANQPRVTEPLAPGSGYTAMSGVIQPPTVASAHRPYANDPLAAAATVPLPEADLPPLPPASAATLRRGTITEAFSGLSLYNTWCVPYCCGPANLYQCFDLGARLVAGATRRPRGRRPREPAKAAASFAPTLCFRRAPLCRTRV